ncbi:MAG: DNA recombination protein RmuC [Muribaculaceae bacterium]|nr:DNA recombination protein RmuC [Muribaculaceae bacterium]
MDMIFILSAVIIALLCLNLILFRKYINVRDNLATKESEIASRDVLIHSQEVTLSEIRASRAKLESELDHTRREFSDLSVANGKLQERISIFEQESKRLKEEADSRFTAMAQQILEEKAKLFKETNETRLLEILSPFKDNIEQFKKTIADNYVNEAKDRHSMQEHLKQLMELNQTIGKEAKDLTQALKGNTKMQGDWGEMILENILEKSGLTRDQEFFVQVTRDESGNVIKNEEGSSLRPDVIVNMPDKKKMIIDSKVSLTAYVNFVNAEDKADQERYISQHILSIKNHINELKTKKYQDFISETSEFVMMFIPNEGAYISAMQYDTNLWQSAYNSRVVIISPTHLISVLKLVSELWRHDKQTKNANNIAVESGKLYDKFYGFIQDMSAIEKNLKGTQTAFDSAMNKLYTGRGNLIRQVENLKMLGAKASKSLPESED